MTEELFKDVPTAPTGRKLTAKMRVTTPLFMGDGEQGKDNSVAPRPPAIKGALRFWWRALVWARVRKACKDDNTALAKLHGEEAALFGTAAGKEPTFGQALFALRVTRVDDFSDWTVHTPEPGCQYLLGQGLYHYRNGLLRKAANPGMTLHIELAELPKRHISEDQWHALEDAFVLLGLVGNMGARARKGFGSLALQEIAGGRRAAPNDLESYQTALKALLPTEADLPSGLPPFTAFSTRSRIDISSESDDNPTSVLNAVGEELQMYRSYGRNGVVNHREAEKFCDDHDVALNAAQGGKLTRAPKRVVFGLPHNYFFSDNRGKLDISAHYGGDRRASPLFLHIHQFSSGKSIAVHLLLPADFLPKEDHDLKYKTRYENTLKYTPENVDWGVIHTYLNRFNSRITLLKPSGGTQ